MTADQLLRALYAKRAEHLAAADRIAVAIGVVNDTITDPLALALALEHTQGAGVPDVVGAFEAEAEATIGAARRIIAELGPADDAGADAIDEEPDDPEPPAPTTQAPRMKPDERAAAIPHVVRAITSEGRFLYSDQIVRALLRKGQDLDGNLPAILKDAVAAGKLARVRYNNVNRLTAYGLPGWTDEGRVLDDRTPQGFRIEAGTAVVTLEEAS